jgi:hypothetical protein
MTGLDPNTFDAIVAEARAARVLAAAGLDPEVIGRHRTQGAAGRVSPQVPGEDRRDLSPSTYARPRPAALDTVPTTPYRQHAPRPVETVNLPNNDLETNYRITGNDNPANARAKPEGNLRSAPAARPPASGPPPSTLDEIEGALARYESSRPRSVQRTLGPSELGTPCRRQIALKLAGVQRHERGGLPWAPMCGTAVHSLMESVLEAENERLGRPRWIIEETVHLDDELKGHGDAFDTDHGLVVDWKYTGTTARRKARRRNVPNAELVSTEYRVQAHLYGLGHANAGRDVRYVRLVMLARSHDFRESVEWTEEYDERIAVDAMTRFYATRDEMTNMDGARFPERLAAIEATPGEACKWCPFQRPGPEVDATGCAGNTGASMDVDRFF